MRLHIAGLVCLLGCGPGGKHVQTGDEVKGPGAFDDTDVGVDSPVDTPHDTGTPHTDVDTDADTGTTSHDPTCPPGVAAIIDSTAEFATVAAAFDAVVSGNIVEICPGTWSVSEVLPAVDLLKIMARNRDPATTILTGDSTHRIFTVAAGTTLFLQFLTLQDGHTATKGGAVLAEDVAQLWVTGCHFVGNHSAHTGGALRVTHAPSLATWPIRFDQVVFRNNTAGVQAGAMAIGAPTLQDVMMLGTVFQDNVSDGIGGALTIDSFGGQVVMTDTTFQGNQAVSGGGLMLQHAMTARISTTKFLDNRSDAGASALSVSSVSGTNELTLAASALLRNTSLTGAAVHADPRGTLTATLVDFGSGPNNNTPDDLDICFQDFGSATDFVLSPDLDRFCD